MSPGDVDQASAPETERDDVPPTADRPRGGGAGTVAPWIVAIVAVAVAIVALVQWWQLEGAASADEEARQVAGRVVSALTNWQADDLQAVRETLEANGTDRFTGEASELLDQFAQGLQQARARSVGEVLDLVADAEAGTDAAVALAVVRQEVTNASLERPDVQCWGTRVILQHRADRWLVDGVELYGPNQCPEGEQEATGDAPDAEGSP